MDEKFSESVETDAGSPRMLVGVDALGAWRNASSISRVWTYSGGKATLALMDYSSGGTELRDEKSAARLYSDIGVCIGGKIRRAGDVLFDGDERMRGNEVRKVCQRYDKPPLSTFSEGGDNYLNAWCGFGAKLMDDLEFKKWTDDGENRLALFCWVWFINEIVCNHDGDVAYDVFNWLGHIFKHPERKPMVCLCLKGAQGSGKGEFCRLVAAMVGELNFSKIDNAQEIVNGFNASAIEPLVVNLDEWNYDGADEKLIANMKSLITEERINRRQKNEKAREVKTSTRYILTSNMMKAFLVTNGDRRHDIIEMSNEACIEDKKRNGDFEGASMCHKFWSFLDRHIDGCAAPMRYLLEKSYDKDYSPVLFKRTKEYNRQAGFGTNTIVPIIKDGIASGELKPAKPERDAPLFVEQWKKRYEAEGRVTFEFNDLYNHFSEKTGIKYTSRDNFEPLLNTAFGSDIEIGAKFKWKDWLKDNKINEQRPVFFKKEYIDRLTDVKDEGGSAMSRSSKRWNSITADLGLAAVGLDDRCAIEDICAVISDFEDECRNS